MFQSLNLGQLQKSVLKTYNLNMFFTTIIFYYELQTVTYQMETKQYMYKNVNQLRQIRLKTI